MADWWPAFFIALGSVWILVTAIREAADRVCRHLDALRRAIEGESDQIR